MLRMIRHRLRSALTGRNKHVNNLVSDLYGGLVTKYEAGEIRGIAIIPSAFEFEELYNQRTINLSKYLSGKGYGVIYVAWQWYKTEKLEKSYRYVYKNVIQVPLYGFLDTHFKLAMFSAFRKRIYMVTLPAKVFYDLLFFMKESCFDVYYDIMDDWEQFHKVGQAPWYKSGIDEAVILNANKVTAVSARLVRKFSHLREDIVCVGNGYDPEILSAGEAAEEKPGETAGETAGETPTIRAGYFGHLTDAWFDWQMLFDLTEKHGNVIVEIIGYGESAATRKRIGSSSNIKLIGKVEPGALRAYASKWHVAIIPFKKSELSEAVDPIKIYEYLYFGLPAVVTGISHLRDYPYVEVVDNDPEQFYNALLNAYGNRRENGVDNDKINLFLSDKTWENRFDRLFEPDFLSVLYDGLEPI